MIEGRLNAALILEIHKQNLYNMTQFELDNQMNILTNECNEQIQPLTDKIMKLQEAKDGLTVRISELINQSTLINSEIRKINVEQSKIRQEFSKKKRELMSKYNQQDKEVSDED